MTSKAWLGERLADAAETRDHFVEYQEDVVLVADLAQALQVADGRQDHPGRSGDGLDDDRGDGGGVVQRDQALQLVGEMGAPLRQSARERIVFDDPGCAADDPRPGSMEEPKNLRLLTMPPTDMPPNPTPW